MAMRYTINTVRSIGLIILQSRTKGIKIFLVFLITIFFSQCKPVIEVTKEEFKLPNEINPVPYQIYQPRKLPIEHTLLYLPPALDSFNLAQSALLPKLLKRGFEVVVIRAPKKGDYYTLKEMNFASQRQKEIINTALYLRNSKRAQFKNLKILGVDEGAYLAPLVASQLKADAVIFVNASPFGPLVALERLTKKDSLSPTEVKFIQQNFSLDSLKELTQAVKRVRSTSPNKIILGLQTNKYWLSMGAPAISEVYSSLQGYNYWVFFKDYPLTQKTDYFYVKQLNAMQGNKSAPVFILPGNGTLKDNGHNVFEEQLENILIP
jgi:hypothetical protein